ncbi:Hsp70 family protein [Mycolicibacterium sp. 050232]|uniref:Hsp70 family protein n=1 Tax=Mycolicibacterium sp. 050232 TaxID=3113982 RepID=UPI002E2AF465|nr:Hsp70 family protein [Mycolicibacterium sp. 050232]MED5811134.1 Hsp70 family protein [Mycolicibacterium sp. 050232]
MRDCLGLSVGATNLVAIADRMPLVRPAVFALGGGPVIDGFVERVGDPVPLVAADGSTHRAEHLVAGAVEALTREASVTHRPDVSVLTVPAHWSPAAVDSVRRAMPGVRVVPDSVAALTAIQAHPGLPARGVVALCDFGGSGTSLTLADASAGFATIGQTVRLEEFSGDLIDQEVLRLVLRNLEAEPAGTAAVATLVHLREQCRAAKERLSDESATSLSGPSGAIRLTRAELDAVVSGPLGGVIEALLDLLRRNGIHPAQLAALVTVGGGARIPLVTQRFSEAFRMPVTTVPQAQVIAAVGAALLGRRGADETATQVAVAPTADPVLGTATVAASALAWSVEDSVAEVAAFVPESVTEDSARPEFMFSEPVAPPAPPRLPWYRRGGVVAYAGVFLAVVGTVGMVLSARADRLDASATGLLAPQNVPAESALAPAAASAPPTRTVVVRDPSWPGPGAGAPAAAPRQASAPRLVQSRQSAPLAPAPQRMAPAPRAPQPRPAAPAPAPALPPPPAAIPVPPLVFPPVTLPQLPIPTFKPPVSESPSPSPSPTPSPTPSPEPSPSPTPSPSPEPSPSPTPSPSPEPTHTPEPSPEPTQAPEPTSAPEPTTAPEPTQAPAPTSAVPSP